MKDRQIVRVELTDLIAELINEDSKATENSRNNSGICVFKNPTFGEAFNVRSLSSASEPLLPVCSQSRDAVR